jgi:DNA-binding phage protein
MMYEYLQVMLEENGIECFQAALGDIAKAIGMSEQNCITELDKHNLYSFALENKTLKPETARSIIAVLLKSSKE